MNLNKEPSMIKSVVLFGVLFLIPFNSYALQIDSIYHYVGVYADAAGSRGEDSITSNTTDVFDETVQVAEGNPSPNTALANANANQQSRIHLSDSLTVSTASSMYAGALGNAFASSQSSFYLEFTVDEISDYSIDVNITGQADLGANFDSDQQFYLIGGSNFFDFLNDQDNRTGHLQPGNYSFGVNSWWQYDSIGVDYLHESFYEYNLHLSVMPSNSQAPIPEPNTILLLGSGLVALAGLKNRKGSNFFHWTH